MKLLIFLLSFALIRADVLESYRQMFDLMDAKLSGSPRTETSATDSPVSSSVSVVTVEAGLILIFHPAMADYHFGVHSFFRQKPADPKVDARIVQKRIHDAAMKFQHENRQKEAEVMQRQAEVNQKKEALRYELLRDLNQVLSEPGLTDVAKSESVRKLEDRAFSERRQLDEQVFKLQADYLLWKKKTTEDAWLSEGEKRSRLAVILQEIQSEISEVAKEHGASAVIKRQRSLNQIPSIPFRAENLPVAGLELNPLKTLLDGRFSTGHEQADLRPEYVAKLRLDYLNQYQQLANTLQPIVTQQGFSHQTDITLVVLQRLWKKAGYDKEQIQRLLRVLSFVLKEE